MLTHHLHAMQRITAIRAELQRLAPVSAGRGRGPGAVGEFGRVLADSMAASAPVAGDSSAAARRYDGLIRAAASRYGLSADLVHAVVRAESDYDPDCVSSAGAMGLMQLMPDTARGLGVADAWDPAQNLLGGCRYLRAQLDRFGDLSLALAAYNAGPGAVTRHGGIPPYHETQRYVRRVLGYLAERTEGAP